MPEVHTPPTPPDTPVTGGGKGPPAASRQAWGGAELHDRGLIDAETDAEGKRLLHEYQQGNESAFHGLVEIYSAPVYHFLQKLGLRPDDALDVLQDTWVRVLKAAATYEPRARLLTWILQIAKNLWRDLIRKETLRDHQSLDAPAGKGDGGGETGRRLGEVVPDGPAEGSLAPILTAERDDRLQAAIAQLSEKKRLALVLRVYQGLPYEEISQLVEAPVGTVKYRVHEAIKDLTATLAEEENGDGETDPED